MFRVGTCGVLFGGGNIFHHLLLIWWLKSAAKKCSFSFCFLLERFIGVNKMFFSYRGSCLATASSSPMECAYVCVSYLWVLAPFLGCKEYLHVAALSFLTFCNLLGNYHQSGSPVSLYITEKPEQPKEQGSRNQPCYERHLHFVWHNAQEVPNEHDSRSKIVFLRKCFKISIIQDLRPF